MTYQKQLNQFNRLEILIGRENLEKIQTQTILVVGIGGVGGYVVESLVRSGVSNIIIVDPDTIDETNLNRQILALTSTIGKKKVDVMKKRILDIHPNVVVTSYDCFFNNETKNQILDQKIDFMIDCCDLLESKKLFIQEALKRKIPFISSMGTANKLDPSKLEIVEVRKTYNDPLAKRIREFIKKEKISQKIMVLTSTEVPKKRGKLLGSSAFVPSSAGLLISSYVIRKIIK